MSETNPFRLSMLQRSQSPLDDPFEESVAPHSGSSSAAAQPPQTTGGPYVPQAAPYIQQDETYTLLAVRSNPFRVDLTDGPSGPATRSLHSNNSSSSIGKRPEGPGDALNPPSYYESEGRRHSDPQLTRSDEEKSRLPARDDSYREGYEEGMRIARECERQRRRELRERERERRRQNGERNHTSNHTSSHTSGRNSSHNSNRHESSHRSRSKSDSAGGGSSRSKKSVKPLGSLDVIDKMDVTGFYGASGFHHDGPFDACTPHRNKASARVAAPIAAFPADGPNNSLTVEDPTFASYRKDEAVFGRDVLDPPPEMVQNSFDPTDRGVKVHGQRTMGLGSTTFIDGTRATKDAIQRERSQNMGRSQSLLQRAPSAANRSLSCDNEEEEPAKMSLLSRVRSLRVGRH